MLQRLLTTDRDELRGYGGGGGDFRVLVIIIRIQGRGWYCGGGSFDSLGEVFVVLGQVVT